MEREASVEEDEHRALLSLVVSGLANAEPVVADLKEHLGFSPDEPDVAIRVLADARGREVHVVRPFVLRALGRFAARWPDMLAELRAPIDQFHAALVAETGLQPGFQGDPGEVLWEAWSTGDSGEYQTRIASVVAAPLETVVSPPCDDRTEESAGSGVYSVESAWQSPFSVAALRPWTDPMHWPSCSGQVFFKGMQQLAMTPGTGADWKGEFLETVEIVPGHPITTNLTFAHREVPTGTELTLVVSHYDLTAGKPIDELSRDDGMLRLQRRLGAAGLSARADVAVTKTYCFTNPAFRNWPTVACDTFFGELTAKMASNCAQGYA